MQTLNLRQAQSLNSALNSTEVVIIDGKEVMKSVLKTGKFLPAASVLIIMSIKKRLRNKFADVSTTEKELLEDCDAIVNFDGSWIIKAKSDKKEDVQIRDDQTEELNKKIKELHKSFSIEIPDPFIEEKEFLGWTRESSNEPASVLAEFLLKDFDVVKVTEDQP